jgi:AbrB family looped-hinge helix DNA binding protein
MPTTTLTRKGQITIPKVVRDFLRIKPAIRHRDRQS